MAATSTRRSVKRAATLALLACLALLTAACQFTQSDFARTASNDGSAFAAAALTLEDAHNGRVTAAYAAASFVNFRAELKSADQQLASAGGAPDAPVLHHLLALERPALRAVASPCLDAACDWRGQVAALHAASDALTKAAGG